MLGKLNDLSAVGAAESSEMRLNCSPNPFNAHTEIQFEGRSGSSVKIAIYDVAGRVVREIYSGICAGVPFELSWNGDNNDGHPVSSGTYFLRAESSSSSLVTKLVLVK